MVEKVRGLVPNCWQAAFKCTGNALSPAVSGTTRGARHSLRSSLQNLGIIRRLPALALVQPAVSLRCFTRRPHPLASLCDGRSPMLTGNAIRDFSVPRKIILDRHADCGTNGILKILGLLRRPRARTWSRRIPTGRRTRWWWVF